MKQTWQKVKEEVAKLLAKGIIAILSSAVLILATLIPKDAIRRVDSLIWFWSAVILFAACLALVVYIFRQRPKYIFISELKIYQEKKTGNYFCPSCMANGKKSPLGKYELGWQCLTKDCKSGYYEPGKEPPKRKVISKGIDNGWVKRW